MKFNYLASLEKFTPLRSVVGDVDLSAFLGKVLYRVGGGMYIYLTNFVGGKSIDEGPFLFGIFCAPDDSALMRATAMKVEGDLGAFLTPPPGFLPDDLPKVYGAILNWIKEMRPNVCQESASYRIASDGIFVHRTIETEKYTFYFRGENHDDHEPPYAILYKN